MLLLFQEMVCHLQFLEKYINSIYFITALTDPNLSIFPMKIPLPLIGTTPTDDPVKTQKSLLRFFYLFLTLFKTNLNEFNGFI